MGKINNDFLFKNFTKVRVEIGKVLDGCRKLYEFYLKEFISWQFESII